MAVSPRLGKLPRSGFFGPNVSLRFKANSVLRLADEHLGFWTSDWYRAVAEAHDRMAEKAQQGMVDRLQAGIEETERPQRGTNYLEESLLHEDNRLANASGFLVGRERWLNQSPARHYWRGIEEGIGSYTTTALFFGPLSRYTYRAPGSGREVTTDYVPPMREWRRANLRMPQIKGPTIHVSEFPGYHYMSGAVIAFERLSPIDIYNDVLSSYGLALQPNQLRGKR